MHHHHNLEEQIRQQRRGIKFIEKNAWKWNAQRTTGLKKRITNLFHFLTS